METEGKRRRKGNRLLQGLVIVSLAVHGVIFMHITGLLHSETLSRIELSLRDVSRPVRRSIPRPPYRPKEPPRTEDVKKLEVRQRPIPTVNPVDVAPAEAELPEGVVERIRGNDLPSVGGVGLSHWDPGSLGAMAGEFDSREAYFEMVRFKIERQRQYPERARARRMEGRVAVAFTIQADGGVRDVRVVRSSRFGVLDDAALAAVTGSIPFPRPPRRLFGGAVPVEITIVFELT